MPLKNYRTRVSADRSITEIQTALRRLKMRSSYVEWGEDGQPSGLAFDVETHWGRRSYRLPANIAGVRKVLQKQGVGIGAEKAADVAWRSIKDWVEAQVALLEAGAADFEQVMLPYMQSEEGKTMYELATERYQPSLPPGGAR